MLQTIELNDGKIVECVIDIAPQPHAFHGWDRFWKPYRNLWRTHAKYMVVVENRVRYSRDAGISLAAHIERQVRKKADGWKDLPIVCDLFIPQRSKAYRARIEYGSVKREGVVLGAEAVKSEIGMLGEGARVVECEHRKEVCPSDDLAVELSFSDLGKSKYRRPARLFLFLGWAHPSQAFLPIACVAAYVGYAYYQDSSEEDRLRMNREAERATREFRQTLLNSRRNLCPLQWAGFRKLLQKDWMIRGRGLSDLGMDENGNATWSGRDWSVGRRIEIIRDFAEREAGTLQHDVGVWQVKMQEWWDQEEATPSDGIDMEVWYSTWRVPVEQRGGNLQLGSIEQKASGTEYRMSYSHLSGEDYAVLLFESVLSEVPCKIESAAVDYLPNGQRSNLSVRFVGFGPSALGDDV